MPDVAGGWVEDLAARHTQPFADIPPWPPARWTEPLSIEFPSAFDAYAPLFQIVWRNFAGYELEPWQIALIRAILELYPEGHPRAGQLRWLTVVVSFARQNGKTEIAAALGLWALLVKKTALVIGIASNAEQARLVYERTMAAIKGTPQLRRMFRALTDTRGIRTLSGGKYEMKAAKSAALQGLPLDLGIVDELHIVAAALWNDLVNGLGGRPNCFVAGITTAGDDSSALLLHLYDLGEAAITAGAAARMGFFVWESPEARVPDDDDTLGRFLARSNPGVASGRVDLENTISAVRALPEADAIRYRLNRFLSGTSKLFSLGTWLAGRTRDPFPAGVQPVITFDRTPDWSYASVHAFAKMPDGSTYCDVVASLVKPTLGDLVTIALRLSRYSPITFGMDGYVLRDLGKELERHGLPVTIATQGDLINGSALFFAKMKQGKLKHPGHALMSMQIPAAERKDIAEGFRIKRTISSDGVIGHVLGVQLAETKRDAPMQIF